MVDNRSDKVKLICSDNVKISCNQCPLQVPCATRSGDTKVIYDIRMNAAAEDLE